MARWFPPRTSPKAYFCVVGQPIAHSRSPQIHAAFAAQTGRELNYERIEVGPGELATAVAEFRTSGGIGMNITVPLKEEACRLATLRLPRAAAAGAANTLWFDAAGAVLVDNTDGVGLVRDLELNHAIALAGRRILLLGAGGAARGVIPALLEAAPATVLISNRTPARAAALAQHFAGRVPVSVLAWGTPPERAVDLVINATSLSLQGELPALAATALRRSTVCYDMMYGNSPTVFMVWAREHGAAAVFDGLGMLVEQAACAFEIWHGVKPSTAAVIAGLRASLQPN